MAEGGRGIQERALQGTVLDSADDRAIQLAEEDQIQHYVVEEEAAIADRS